MLVAFVTLAGHHTMCTRDGHKISVAQFYLSGLIAFAVVAFAFTTLLVDLVTLRQSGILRRRRATPVPAQALIGGRTLSCIVVVLGTTAALVFVARDDYNVHVSAAAVPAHRADDHPRDERVRLFCPRGRLVHPSGPRSRSFS